MRDHFFKIEGSKEKGTYVVIEINRGVQKQITEIQGRNYGGLKESRQRIGEYLQRNRCDLNETFAHQCIKPGRRKNPVHEWTVTEYLIGVPKLHQSVR